MQKFAVKDEINKDTISENYATTRLGNVIISKCLLINFK